MPPETSAHDARSPFQDAITGLDQPGELPSDSETLRRLLTENRAAARQTVLAVLEQVTDLAMIVQHRRVVWCNQAVSESTGFAPEELAGRDLRDLFPPAQAELLVRRLEDRLAGRLVPNRYEVESLRKDGRRLILDVGVFLAELEGTPSFVVLARDLTERRLLEENLRQQRDLGAVLSSAETLEETVRVGLDSIAQITEMPYVLLHVLDKSTGGLTLVRTRGLASDSGLAVALHPAGSRRMQLLAAGLPFYGNFSDLPAESGGEDRWRESVGDLAIVPLQQAGKLIACLTLGAPEERGLPLSRRNIIETVVSSVGQAIIRKLAEEELRESEEKFRTLAEEILDGVIMHAEGRILWVNKATVQITGYPADELLGGSLLDLVEPDARELLERRFQARRNGAEVPACFELTLARRDGTRVILEVCAQGITWQRKNATLLVFREITARKQAEEALRLTQFSLDSAEDAVFWIDREGKFIYVNGAACRSLGYTRGELLSLKIFDVDLNLTPEGWARFWQRETEQRFTRELSQRTKEGRFLPVEVTTSRVTYGAHEYACAFARDISERKRAEAEQKKLHEKVQQTQKLESLGILAGGIAHDFNNLLMGILGNASLALLDLPADSPGRSSLQQIENAAQRAAELTNQLLAYSGRGQFVVQPVNLTRLVEEMTNLLKISISKKALLNTRLDKSVPLVEAEPTQIRQVIMNLITNASDALGDLDGVISIATGVIEADPGYLAGIYLGDLLAPGRYVFAEVADTGCGMDEATLARIFDPFFTTKFTGRGLGLAAVLGIVRGHRGGIKVTSTLGQGTSFRVLLPATDSGTEQTRTEPESLQGWRGQGTILVVDDEEGVRNIIKLILSEFGFAVITAEDGPAAIAIFREQHREIAAVILDLTMPHMSGVETFRELRAIRPDVKVILSSGYSEQESISLFTNEGLAGFIQKPYNVTSLMEKLRQILGS